MSILLIASAFILYFLYTLTLFKNTVHSFISGAVYKWYKLNDESSSIEPQITKEFITSKGFRSAKGLVGIFTLVWVLFAISDEHFIFLLAIPIGFISAVITIKMTHSKFNVRKTIQSCSKVVAFKALNIGQLSSNDITNNTLKAQLSNLDLLLKNDDFVKFAQKLKRAHFYNR